MVLGPCDSVSNVMIQHEVWVTGVFDGYKHSGIAVYYGDYDPRTRYAPYNAIDKLKPNSMSTLRAHYMAMHEALRGLEQEIEEDRCRGPARIHSESDCVAECVDEFFRRRKRSGTKTNWGKNRPIARAIIRQLGTVNKYYKNRGWPPLAFVEEMGLYAEEMQKADGLACYAMLEMERGSKEMFHCLINEDDSDDDDELLSDIAGLTIDDKST